MEVSQWKDRFNELEKNKTNQSDRYKKLQKDFVILQNSIAVKSKQLELQQIEYESKRIAGDSLNEEKMAKCNVQITKLKAERKELQETNAKLSESIAAMTENIDNLNELCEGYTDSIRNYKDR